MHPWMTQKKYILYRNENLLNSAEKSAATKTPRHKEFVPGLKKKRKMGEKRLLP
jgi:hypothetical protein